MDAAHRSGGELVIYSGLDWSGSPGMEPHDPLLVLAIVHFDEAALTRLAVELGKVRSRLRLSPDHVFKHVNASIAARRAFFQTLGRTDMQGHVHLIDKAAWTEQYVKTSRGPDRIRDGIVTLVVGCPDALVAGQRLFVDLQRKDMEQVRNLRTAVRQALRGVQRKSFANVQPCPDHRQHGQIIQVADMIAGEVREQGALTGPYLPALGGRIRVV